MRILPTLLILGCSQPQAQGPGTASPTNTGVGTPAATGGQTTTTPSTGEEICDGIDNDGDGEIDEEGGPIHYADTDGDVYGDDAVTTTACDPGPYWAVIGGDCDDTNPSVYPNAGEQCDGVDNNCDGVIDEGHREDWYLGTLRDGLLYRIDLTSLVATPAISFSSPDPTATFNSSDMLEPSMGVAHSNNNLEMWSLDICGGAMAPIGSTTVGDMGGVAFNGDGDLFGIQGSTEQIMQIDPQTGQAVAIGSFGSDVGNAGMAYDCANDAMYALDSKSDLLFEIDHQTGAVLSTQALSIPIGGSNGLEWDHTTGTLLTTSSTTLYQVDPATAAVTNLGNITGVSVVDDLAFFPTCP